MSSSLFHIQQHILPCSYVNQYPRRTVNGDDDQLHIVIKQYTPIDNPHPKHGDVTLIAAHANGVGKELYEPLWDELHAYTKSTGAFRIRSIWIADVAFQGASGVLNENKLGNEPSWYDHPRDLLHMINHFSAQMPRPLIGIGHSMGGNNITNLALMHPRLLHSVILIDPVIQRTANAQGNYMPAYLSTFRRDIWPSRAVASTAFHKNPFYQSWDPRVLDLWIEHGLRDLPTAIYPIYTPTSSEAAPAASLVSASATSAAPVPPTSPTDKPVTLTTTKHQEVFAFLRSNYPAPGTPLSAHKPNRSTHPDLEFQGTAAAPFYRPEPLITFTKLPELRPHCLYIFAGNSALSLPDMRADKMAVTGTGISGSGGAAEGAVTQFVVANAGHFVPFEKPAFVAEAMGSWMSTELLRWVAEEETERREWGEVPREEKARISKAWEFWMKAAFGGEIFPGEKKGKGEAKL